MDLAASTLAAAGRPGGQADLPLRLGGSLCLDFVNTVEPRLGDGRRDYLLSYRELVAWARAAELLTDAREQRLLEVAGRWPAAAAASFDAAIELRETLYRVFAAVAACSTPAQADLAGLQHAYADAMGHARIVPDGGGLKWAWDEADQALDAMVWPVARSAAELATSGQLHRVKQCPHDQGGCGWLFLDGTKNAIRRWCSMQDCGGRAKARRQYARRRAAKRQ